MNTKRFSGHRLACLSACFTLLIIGSSLFTACKKNNDAGGSLKVQMKYELSENAKHATVKSTADIQEEYYTQFGDYITSITPSVFIIKFLDSRFQNFPKDGQMWNNSIFIVSSNMQPDDIARFADFTNNNVVNITPITDCYDTRIPTTFNIFFFSTMFIYQEFELPEQYRNITNLANLEFEKADRGIDYRTSMEIGGLRDGLTVKGSEMPFVKDKLFPNDMPHCYVFGETDSSYVWKHTDASGKGQCIDDPICQWGYIVRSNKYNQITIPAIPENKTLTLSGTMSFYLNGLIQVYAGADNIPYTSDDIFVYAPKYWERLNVSLTSN